MKDIKKEIIAYADKIEIDEIGFCSAEPFYTAKEKYLIKDKEGFLCSLEESQGLDYKVYPELTLKGAKSFIVILLSYQLKENIEEDDEKAVPRGKISASSVFKDYHHLVFDKLDSLKNYIEEKYQARCISLCDASPFSDREIAHRAGLGEVGRNSFLINKNFGTAFYIGYLLTDLALNHLKKEESKALSICLDCNKCQVACPGNAIIGNGTINSNKCISFLTQSKELTDENKKSMGNNIYGCDICQLVCPYNKEENNKEITPLVVTNPSLESILQLSNKEFKESYKKTSAGWRGKKYFQRNAVIALGNSGSDQCVQILFDNYLSKSSFIKEEISGALKKIGTIKAQDAFVKLAELEEDVERKSSIVNKKFL